jgi:hypothetical protein
LEEEAFHCIELAGGGVEGNGSIRSRCDRARGWVESAGVEEEAKLVAVGHRDCCWGGGRGEDGPAVFAFEGFDGS